MVLLAVMQSQAMGQDFILLNLAEGEGEVEAVRGLVAAVKALLHRGI